MLVQNILFHQPFEACESSNTKIEELNGLAMKDGKSGSIFGSSTAEAKGASTTELLGTV